MMYKIAENAVHTVLLLIHNIIMSENKIKDYYGQKSKKIIYLWNIFSL